MTTEELSQTKWWTGNDGLTVRVRDMGPSHRANLLRWLERNAGKLRWNEIVQGYAFSCQLRGEMALDMADREIGRLEEMSDADYLDGLPFVVKLRKRVAKDALRPLAEREALDTQASLARRDAKMARTVAQFDEPDPSEAPATSPDPNEAVVSLAGRMLPTYAEEVQWRRGQGYSRADPDRHWRESQTPYERIADLEDEVARLRREAAQTPVTALFGEPDDDQGDTRFAINR